MNSAELLKQMQQGEVSVPTIKQGKKISWIVLKKIDTWLLISCEWGFYTGIILSKELKDLERNNVELSPGTWVEAEIVSTTMKHDEWYYIVSVSKLLQYDVWNDLLAKADKDEIFTVIPTEANLWGLLIDMHGIKWFIPLSQLAPVNYPRVEDGDSEKIFEKLIGLIGREFTVRVLNVDEEDKRVILSEREALREEKEAIMKDIAIWSEFDGIISGVSSYGFFVTIGGGIEWLVHISEITYGHVNSIDRLWKVWENMKVQVIGLEEGKISLSAKKLKPDPRSIIPEKFRVWDIIEWEVVKFVPYGAFVRMYDDINGLIHLSELDHRPVNNASEMLKMWQVVRSKVILIDIDRRKIWLSMKVLKEPPASGTTSDKSTSEKTHSPVVKAKAYLRPEKRTTETTDSHSDEPVTTKEVAQEPVSE